MNRKTSKITNKPDGKGLTGYMGKDGTNEVHDRKFLAEVFEDDRLIDSAYHPTKEAAESWLGIYNL